MNEDYRYNNIYNKHIFSSMDDSFYSLLIHYHRFHILSINSSKINLLNFDHCIETRIIFKKKLRTMIYTQVESIKICITSIIEKV